MALDSGSRMLTIPFLSRRVAALGLAAVTIAAGFTAVAHPAEAEAATAADFQPGFIISDDLFYDDKAMSEAQIQAFLDQKIGACQNGRCLNVLRANLPTYPAHTSGTTGNLVCKEVPGGSNILASTIIFRVQQACGISAKVILVTLQKEQGLITGSNSKAPTNYSLNFAMGWACPDSTGCVDASSWFGYQVYRGGRQLVTYKLGNFARQPGVHNILFHPNSSCGFTAVNIRNFATAALYNYTPYQPTAASLAAWPNAAAGSCNSYGNRNFFFFYNSWFGSTFSVDGPFALDQAYAEAGGSAGSLGAQVAASSCVIGVAACWREYENGYIGWRSSTGAYVVAGASAIAYRNAGGPTGRLGYPTTSSNAIVGPNGDGSGQNFTGGQVLVSANGAFSLTTRLLATHSYLGWVRGAIGWPVSDQVCDGAGTCAQEFQAGYLAAPASGNVISVLGGYAARYGQFGGPSGVLGSPTSAANAISGAEGAGSGQNFSGGQMLSSAAGTFVVSTVIMPTYVSAGWVRGPLGWPTADEVCNEAGQCVQTFRGGSIARTIGGPAYVVNGGAISSKYQELGGSAGPLGAPTSSENPITGAGTSARGQNFQNGQILATSAGAFAINNSMLSAYAANGWIRGPRGWPTSDESCVEGTCTQQFSGGTLVRPASGAAYVLPGGAIGQKYADLGGPSGILGSPTSTANSISGAGTSASGQNFANGQIIETSAGVFAIRKALLDVWVANGWIRGSLGWPVSDEACVDGVCSQEFSGGRIVAPATGAPYVLAIGPIGDKYSSLGGPAGILGLPTSSANPISGANGPGSGQNFQNGQILSSSFGTYVTFPDLFVSYATFGWVRGSLGWPTGDAVCTAPAQCSQTFQFGTLVLDSAGARILR